MTVIKVDNLIYYTLLSGNITYVGDPSKGRPTALDSAEAVKGEKIVIPESIFHDNINYTVEGINAYAFFNCKINGITLPKTIKFIGLSSLDMTSIEQEIILPESLEYIEEWSIASAFFETINITSKVKYIGNGAIGCNPNLRSIILSEENPYFQIVDGILYNNDLTTIIQAPVTINNITIPDTVRIIQAAAFSYTNLTELIIPATVKVINKQIVQSCSQLKKMYILGNSMFNNTPIGSLNGLHSLELFYYQGTKEVNTLIFGNWNVSTISVCHGYTGKQLGGKDISMNMYCAAIPLASQITCQISFCGSNYWMLFVGIFLY